MKNIKTIFLIMTISLVSCNDYLDIENYNNIPVEQFYKNAADLEIGLNGCYAGMRAPIADEWLLTEMRSDNTLMNLLSTSNAQNLDMKDYDIFNPSSIEPRLYNYWLNTYRNIRNTNFLLESMNVNYNPNAGTLTYDAFSLPITDDLRKEASAQASFIRAYHYFNLVRLYGGVFLIHEVVTPTQTPFINRSSEQDIYKLIEADLINASNNSIPETFSAISTSDRGRATRWAAKALLAKVYLTLNRKTEAKTLLDDVRFNSGFQIPPGTTYANIFSTTNELNSEIIFAVRFKAGGIGQGSSLANQFAPAAGFPIVGNGLGFNGITLEYFDSFDPSDARKATNAIPQTSAGRYFSNKHITTVSIANDSEKDWPVLRISDVLLMIAEADGFVSTSVDRINQVRARTGNGLTPLNFNSLTLTTFEKALSDERRWEFGHENQRWFDILRFNTTMSTLTTQSIMHNHFDIMATIYASYATQTGVPPLTTIKSNVNPLRYILPIPQIEIDTNTTINIPQNPGY